MKFSEQESALLWKKTQRSQEELRHLSRRLLLVQEEERRRISLELHDVVARTLTGINYRLDALKDLNSASTKVLYEKIASTQLLVLQSVETVQRFARDLRPSVLDDLGLIPALKSYFKEVRKTTGLQIVFTSVAGVEELDAQAKIGLYRVVQESISNIVQHAKATRVTISLTRPAGKVSMIIRDNGCGFSVDDVEAGITSGHLGLLGMRERMEMVGGTFAIESIPDQKTTIRVSIPLPSVKETSASKTKRKIQ